MSLKAIPGESGLPVFGHTLRFMRDCNSLFDDMHNKYGSVYYNKFLSHRAVHLLSPEGNEFVLLDRENNFSSRLAWNRALKALFPNGLMLRDGDDHRYHRRLMGAPFKAAALEHYVERMNVDVASQISSWGLIDNFQFYPAIKSLTLDLAASIFIGEDLNQEAAQVNQAFVDLVNASLVLVRYPMLGNKYQRGLEGRAFLEAHFRSRIADKKASSDTDMFAEICRAEGDEGERFSQQDIVDHIIFLMMAAHDTTTSSLSSICYALGKHPEWQNKIRDEISSLGKSQLLYGDMSEFKTSGLVLKEALRLYPPLPTIPRAAVRDCEFQGFQIKAGDQVMACPSFTHRMADIWSDPQRFDPERFNDDRAEDKQHRHAWVPFGGGAHKCLGIKFAELQIKLLLFHLLKNYQIRIPAGYEMPYQPAPIGKPSDMLPLKLEVIV